MGIEQGAAAAPEPFFRLSQCAVVACTALHDCCWSPSLLIQFKQTLKCRATQGNYNVQLPVLIHWYVSYIAIHPAGIYLTVPRRRRLLGNDTVHVHTGTVAFSPSSRLTAAHCTTPHCSGIRACGCIAAQSESKYRMDAANGAVVDTP